MSALLDWITASAVLPAPETTRDPEPCSEPATERSPVSPVAYVLPAAEIIRYAVLHACDACGSSDNIHPDDGLCALCKVPRPRPARPVRAARPAARPAVAMVEIMGNTYPVREALKAMGGRWNAGEKTWRVPANRAEEARQIVAAASGVRGGGPRRTYSGECDICGGRCNPRFKICFLCKEDREAAR